MAVNLIINGINPANNTHDNSVVSLADSVDLPGILIWNRSGFRQTDLLTILSTTSNNRVQVGRVTESRLINVPIPAAQATRLLISPSQTIPWRPIGSGRTAVS